MWFIHPLTSKRCQPGENGCWESIDRKNSSAVVLLCCIVNERVLFSKCLEAYIILLQNNFLLLSRDNYWFMFLIQLLIQLSMFLFLFYVVMFCSQPNERQKKTEPYHTIFWNVDVTIDFSTLFNLNIKLIYLNSKYPYSHVRMLRLCSVNMINHS